MARVIITDTLKEEIFKKFKGESKKIISLMISLEDSPFKGKILGQVSGMLIKELRFDSFRFYFITDNYKIKFLKKEELEDLVIKFVRMSNKKEQQKTIDEIKGILRDLGKEGFN